MRSIFIYASAVIMTRTSCVITFFTFIFSFSSSLNVDDENYFDWSKTDNTSHNNDINVAVPFKSRVHNRIMNGRASSVAKHPYQVSLQALHKGKFHHFCGGAILNKVSQLLVDCSQVKVALQYWIVTAAHCINGSKVIIRIRAGSTSQKSGGQVLLIKAIN